VDVGPRSQSPPESPRTISVTPATHQAAKLKVDVSLLRAEFVTPKNRSLERLQTRARFVTPLPTRSMARDNDWRAQTVTRSLAGCRSRDRLVRRRLWNTSPPRAARPARPVTTVDVHSVVTWRSKIAGAATQAQPLGCLTKGNSYLTHLQLK